MRKWGKSRYNNPLTNLQGYVSERVGLYVANVSLDYNLCSVNDLATRYGDHCANLWVLLHINLFWKVLMVDSLVVLLL